MYVSANSPIPIVGELRRSVGLSGENASLFMLPFVTGFTTGSITWFLVARHRSARMLLPLALILVAATTIVLVVAPDPSIAGLARFGAGIATAGFPAAAQAVITRSAPLRQRGRLLGGFAAAVVTGGVIGQALVGALADLWSAEMSLLALCAAAPLLVAGALRVVPAHAGTGAPGIDAGTPGPPIAIGALIRRQWPTFAITALMFGSYWLVLTELAAELRGDRFGLSPAAAGALPLLGAAGALTTLAVGAWTDRVGERRPTVAIVLVGVAALAVMLHPATPLWLFAVAVGTFIAAYWGALPSCTAEVARRADAGERQPAMMAFYAAAGVGAILLTGTGTLWPGWTLACLVSLAAWLASAAIALGWFHHGRPRSRAAAPETGTDRPHAPGGGRLPSSDSPNGK